MMKEIILWREYRGRMPFVGTGSATSLCGLRAASPYRVKGETPWQVKGGSHCPVELTLASARTGYCLTLKAAELAEKLPFSQVALWEKMSGTDLSPACREHAVSIA